MNDKLKELVEMQKTTLEAEKMSPSEAFVKGFLNSVIGLVTPGKRGEKARTRGNAFLSKWVFAASTDEKQEKVDVSKLDLQRIVNEEFEQLDIPVEIKGEPEK